MRLKKIFKNVLLISNHSAVEKIKKSHHYKYVKYKS